MSLTKAQNAARLHGKGNILVSAGAGSGKTRVLTERVLRLVIEENVPLHRLLILTFTNAAAQSMKEKIRKALMSKGRHEDAALVDAAYIMTFDAFALALVKKYHIELGLNDDVAIYDDMLYQVQKKVILKQLFDDYYQAPTPDFLSLLKTFVIHEDETLMNFMLKVDQKADLHPDKERYFATYVSTHFSPTWVKENVHRLYEATRQTIQELAAMAENLSDEKEVEVWRSQFKTLLEESTMDGLLTKIAPFSYPKSRANALDEDSKAIKEDIKREFNKLKLKVVMVPLGDLETKYMETEPFVKIIIGMLKTLNHRLDERKYATHRYPFADIAKMATQLMTKHGKQAELQAMFDYIMVDEYQDTNDLQETFLSLLANDNLFMVGDVKQSIYRFRNANSQIFSNKLESYTSYEDAKTPHNIYVAMNQNFRSRREVLSDINRMFSHLMQHGVGGVDYTADQALDFGQQLYDRHRVEEQDYHAEFLHYEKSERDAEQDEAKIIAEDILKKVANHWQVFDHNTHVLRDCQWKDMAILIDRKSNFESYIEVFNQAGIPLDVYAERVLSDSEFFRVFRNLVTCVVHFKGDLVPDTLKHPFVSLLRSFLVQEQDQTILDWTQGKRPLSSFDVYVQLETLSNLQHAVSLSEWMRACVNVFHLEEKLLQLSDLTANLGRLEGIVHHMKQLETIGMTLKEYEDYLRSADDLEIELTISASKETDNAVRLMTIHKSKGLEFPIVYLPGLTKAFNKADAKEAYQYSSSYGIQLPYPDAVYHYPLFRDLMLLEEDEAILSEQVRLFYVALTRAQEKLIFIIDDSKKMKPKEQTWLNSFADFIHYVDRQKGEAFVHGKAVEVPTEWTRVEQIMTSSAIPIEFHRPEPLPPLKAMQRPSKLSAEDVNPDALAYGTYLHECLFLLDFSHPDVGFIPREDDQKKIGNVLALPLFQDITKGVQDGRYKVLKEYAFIHPDTGQQGIIDLVILEGNNAKIIDYKTSKIDDPAYEKQLQNYGNYLSRVGLQVTKLYLLSLAEGQLKTVPISEGN